MIHQRKLLYWNKLFTSDDSVLFSLSCLVSQRFVAVGCLYDLSSTHVSRQTIKQAVWDTYSVQQHSGVGLMSMPVDFCRHLVGKTLRNICHCDSA